MRGGSEHSPSALREMVPLNDIMLSQSAGSPELFPPPFPPWMSVFRLLGTRAAAASAGADAAGVEGPGHASFT